MTRKVRITTFPPNQNQGDVIEVGVFLMDVSEEVESHDACRNGCFSAEIIESVVATIMLMGRKFIVSPAHWDFEKAVCDYVVAIPQDLVKKIKLTKCPCCNSTFLI